MSVDDRFRSGDTVPPNVLGENRAVDEALAELTQGLEPDEDALCARPGWAARGEVKLTSAAERTTQEMDVRDLQQGRLASGANAEAPLAAKPAAELSALQKKQLITIRTRTVGGTPADFAEDEFIDVSSRPRQNATGADPDPGGNTSEVPRPGEVEGRRRAIIAGGLAVVVLVVGGLVLRNVSDSGVGLETSAATRPTSLVDATSAKRPDPTPPPEPSAQVAASALSAAAAVPTPATSSPFVEPPSPTAPPTSKPRPAATGLPPRAAPKSSGHVAPAKPGGLEPLWD